MGGQMFPAHWRGSRGRLRSLAHPPVAHPDHESQRPRPSLAQDRASCQASKGLRGSKGANMQDTHGKEGLATLRRPRWPGWRGR